mgnify:CR=1 FL=1
MRFFSGHKVSETQQKNIRQLVYDAYEMKRNPSPNQQKPTKRPKRLSTILSKTLMGDLIPFNYKDAIQKEKDAEKPDLYANHAKLDVRARKHRDAENHAREHVDLDANRERTALGKRAKDADVLVK